MFVLSGKDKGRKGKILKVLPKNGKVVVEGMNIRKKHQKARRQGGKGQIVEMASPMDVSNVKIVCPKCAKAVRVGYKITGGDKYRICKKCGEQI